MIVVVEDGFDEDVCFVGLSEEVFVLVEVYYGFGG